MKSVVVFCGCDFQYSMLWGFSFQPKDLKYVFLDRGGDLSHTQSATAHLGVACAPLHFGLNRPCPHQALLIEVCDELLLCSISVLLINNSAGERPAALVHLVLHGQQPRESVLFALLLHVAVSYQLIYRQVQSLQ